MAHIDPAAPTPAMSAAPTTAGPATAGPATAGPAAGAPGGAPRIPCVGAVITDQNGRLLLILRGHEPGKGLWSIPGGRIEAGESGPEALVREVLEETGLTVTCGPLLGTVERAGLAGAVVEISDYRALVTGGVLRAGDDAAAARWVSPAEAADLDAAGALTSELLATLRSWSVLP